MRTLNLTVMVVGIVMILLFSLLCLVSAVYPGLLTNAGDLIAGPLNYTVAGWMGRIFTFVLGITSLLFLMYLLFGNIQAARRERTVVLENPTGEVMVSLPAIEDFARILKGRIDGLRDIKGKVIYSRRGLKVSARISIYSDHNIAEVAQNVQDSVRTYVQKTLNIDQEINPTVIVTKVVNRDRPVNTGGIKTTVVKKKEEDSDNTTEIPLKS